MLLNGLMRTRQKVLLEGLGIGAKMVPAIGFAMLLKIMWSKEVAGVFFIGFCDDNLSQTPNYGRRYFRRISRRTLLLL